MDFGGAVDKAKDLLHGHEDKVDGAIDKGADAVQDKTPDQVDGMVDTAADKAKDVL